MGVGAACGVGSAIVEAVGMVAAGFVGVEDGTGRNRWPLWAFRCCLGAAYPSAYIKASRGVPVAHGGGLLIPSASRGVGAHAVCLSLIVEAVENFSFI